MTTLSFFVAGLPVPQGSFIARTIQGKSFAVPSNDNELKKWRASVSQVAGLALNRSADWPRKCDMPVVASYRFLMPMPKTRPAAIRAQRIVLCTVAPDLDKLCRAIGDSLTDAEVVIDDSRISMGHQGKWEVINHRIVGVEVALAMVDYDYQRELALELLERRESAPIPISAARSTPAGSTRRRRPTAR